MSVKHALLALLNLGPNTAYQLRVGFEEATDHSWPLNDGQVSQTLARLERDGLVEHDDTWSITSMGREELNGWWAAPVSRTHPARDELVIKLAMAALTNPGRLVSIISRQRSATMSTLNDITMLKRDESAETPVERDIAWSLTLDFRIFQIEAELRWLDHVEGRLSSLDQSDIAGILSRVGARGPRAIFVPAKASAKKGSEA